MAERPVRKARWFVAILAGLIVFLLIPSPGRLLGIIELAILVPLAPAIVVAGLIAGARSVRQGLIVVLVPALWRSRSSAFRACSSRTDVL
jgi:hypothetical protein